MSDAKKGWITITVPFEERPVPWDEDTVGGRGGGNWPRSVTGSRAGRELKIAEVDIGAAILRAWPAIEPTDRAKRLAEIEALARAAGDGPWQAVEVTRGGVWETVLRLPTGGHVFDIPAVMVPFIAAAREAVPEMAREIREVDAALAALGVPDDGRPLAERIRVLGEQLAGALEALSDERRSDGGCLCGHGCPRGLGCRSNGEEAPTDTAARELGEMPEEAFAAHVEQTWGPFTGTREATLAKLPADVRAQVEALAPDLPPRIAVLDPASHPLRPAAARMREYLNGSFASLADKPIQLADLALALRIREEDMRAIEAGEKTTDAAGWTEIQTVLFLLGAGTPAEEIADPIGSGALDRALAREEEPDLLAEHLREDADREDAARPDGDPLIDGALPPPEPDLEPAVGDEPR